MEEAKHKLCFPESLEYARQVLVARHEAFREGAGRVSLRIVLLEEPMKRLPLMALSLALLPFVARAAPQGAPAAPGTSAAPRSGGSIRVYIAGEVRRPGIFELPRGARLLDALKAAGGPTAQSRDSLIVLDRHHSEAASPGGISHEEWVMDAGALLREGAAMEKGNSSGLNRVLAEGDGVFVNRRLVYQRRQAEPQQAPAPPAPDEGPFPGGRIIPLDSARRGARRPSERHSTRVARR